MLRRGGWQFITVKRRHNGGDWSVPKFELGLLFGKTPVCRGVVFGEMTIPAYSCRKTSGKGLGFRALGL
jgi:hypothetical protein